ncbi:MAG: hypothetical protein K2I62_05100 [Alistipes sp.]|nr:hypothetical protein [Alistipes sp.]MDE5695299.1 hypothetical protein [Alistipes sp.]MDE6507315.1 hypothetical protein [Alistipes sp.]MDE7344847.1 hypothetical protein [Alistipes sp.]
MKEYSNKKECPGTSRSTKTTASAASHRSKGPEAKAASKPAAGKASAGRTSAKSASSRTASSRSTK